MAWCTINVIVHSSVPYASAMKPAKLALRRSRGRYRMTSPFQTGAAPLEGAGPYDVTVSNRVNLVDPISIELGNMNACSISVSNLLNVM